MRCPPLPVTDDVAVDVRLVLVCVGLAASVGDGTGAVVGIDVGVVGGVGDGVGESVGVGVGVAAQLQEALTEFIGPVKVIVSLAGQEMLEGTAMFTEACSWG